MAESGGSLRSLDAPGALSRRHATVSVALLLAYAGVVALAYVHAEDELPVSPAFVTAQSLALAIVGCLTALVLFTEAGASGQRVLAILACASLFVGLVALASPMVHPGSAADPNSQLVGGVQSGPTQYYLTMLGWTLCVLAGSIVELRDSRSGRRPGLQRPIRSWVGMTAGVSVLAVLVVFLATDAVPPLIAADGRTTDWVAGLSAGLFALAVLTCAATMLQARRGSIINVFLAILGVTLLGQAIVNLAVHSRWTVGWYSLRVLQLVTMLALLVLLIWAQGRIERWTRTAAERDTLTGTLRRSHFHLLLHAEMERLALTRGAAALLWIDLDGFKSTNERLGHAAGDAVLKEVGSRLMSLAGPNDLVCRLGGDEFGLLAVSLASAGEADDVAVRVRQALRTPYPVDSTTVLLSASVGVVPIGEENPTPEVLLQRADLAMSAAKRGGGDRTTRYIPRMEVAAATRATLRAQLAEALRTRSFSMDYQPIVELPSSEVVGVEALVRWLRDGKRVTAGAFLPAIEATGQAQALGALVLELVGEDCPRILAELPPTGFITVNLTVMDLEDARTVEWLLAGPLSGDAAQIVLEITETAQFEHAGAADRALDKLRRAGYPLAIDDFGTGYSNFTRLEQLKPAILKLDRSLVVRSGSGMETAQDFLDASARIGHAVGARVLAEGVETERDLLRAADLGIDLAQGFYFSRPLPLAEALNFVREGQRLLPHPQSLEGITRTRATHEELAILRPVPEPEESTPTASPPGRSAAAGA